MADDFLPITRPSIGEAEIRAVAEALRSGWITTGPRVRQFEEEFASLVGAPSALAVNSCTAGLRLALASAGIGSGDAVVTSPLTFCSSLHVVEQAGAQVALADVEPDTLNLDPVQAKEAIMRTRQNGLKPRAIVATHLHGHPCDLEPLIELCEANDLVLIEDAAHAFPARWHGRLVGSPPPADVRWFTAFSFYATKNLTTGEGGMLVGAPPLLEHARILSLHGMSRDAWKRYGADGSWFYEVAEAGFKFNMTDVCAAIGIEQLKKLNAMQAARSTVVARYNAEFSVLRGLEIPAVRPGADHAWHIYNLRLRPPCPVSRDDFIAALKARNIGSSVHFIPNHIQPYYRDKYRLRPEHFPVAWREYQRMLSLPLFPGMTGEEVDHVIGAVSEIVKAAQDRPVGA